MHINKLRSSNLKITQVKNVWPYDNRNSPVWRGRTANNGDDENVRHISSESSIWAWGTVVVQKLNQSLPSITSYTVSTGPGWSSTRHEKTPVVVTTATGIPDFPRRILIWRLKEGETVETGDWGSNKQFARYPLTVEEKVAMLEVAEREERGREKNEGKEWNGRSWNVECGKEVPLVVVNTAIHQKSNRPPKTLRVRTTKTPYLKVVGIFVCGHQLSRWFPLQSPHYPMQHYWLRAIGKIPNFWSSL